MFAMTLARKATPYLPRPVVPAMKSVFRVYMRLHCFASDVGERLRGGDAELPALPPARLRYRVHGSTDRRTFVDVGRRCAADVARALDDNGGARDGLGAVLDFGCGCGRIALWMKDVAPGARLWGTDIDGEAVAWCRDHVEGAFGVNGGLPPLDYGDGVFDLVLAVSVFTHLDEERQFFWLEELRRVTQAGGRVLASVFGAAGRSGLPREAREALERDGFLYRRPENMKGVFPDWYQSAYHTEAYIRRAWSRCFEVLDYRAGGLCAFQDVVVLRRG